MDPKCDARAGRFVPAPWAACLVALMLAAGACRSTPDSAPSPAASVSPELALETFDEVWRIIYEHHFDTNFNNVDWLAAREEYRPRVASASTPEEVRNVIQKMLDLLQVSHLAIVSSDVAGVLSGEDDEPEIQSVDEAHAGTTGMHVRYSDEALLVTDVDPESPAAKAGVKPGWRIREIEGRPISRFVTTIPDDLQKTERDFVVWRKASNLLEGEPGSEVEISFLNEQSKPLALRVERTLRPGVPIQFGSLPVLYADLDARQMEAEGKTIGLIRFNIWMLPTAIAFNQAIEEHRGADGIIIDLRGNVGGVIGMIIGVAGHFFTEPLSLGTLVTRDNRLNLFVNPRFVSASGKRVQPFGGPLAILVDEASASASEVFAGGMKELGRARIFGRPTTGQALPAIYEELPNGDVLYHPFADFVTETGVRFEGRGVIPDEIIELDREALLQGRDRTLEAAVEWIQRVKTEPESN